MASGQKYAKELNRDAYNVKTPAEYNAGTDQWEMPVKLTGSIGKENIYVVNSGAVAAGVENTVLDAQYPVVIDLLEFAASNSLKTQIRIQPYRNGVLTSTGLLSRDGSGVVGFYPADINQSVSGLFDVLLYDDTNLRYKFTNKKELVFPEGVKITIRNIDSTNPYNIGCLIMGRKVS